MDEKNGGHVKIRNPIPAGPPVTIYPAGTFWGYKDYGGTAVAKLHFHPYLEYLVGYDFQKFSGRDDVLLIALTKERVQAGIGQVRTTDELSTKGRLAAGLRHNKTRGAKKTVWNASGRYDFSDVLFVEANGGTSFLLPDASQLYGNDPCCEIGNPNLKREESLSLNASVGGKIPFGSALSWKATYFQRRITNLVDYDYDNPAFPNGTYKNVGDKVRGKGVDLLVTATLADGWNIAASYTWSQLRNEGSSLQRDRAPKQYAKGRISYEPEALPFGANLSVDWVGDAYTTLPGFGRLNYGNYALVDLGFHLYPDSGRKHRFGFNVENLFYTRGTPRTLRVSYGITF